MRLRVFALTGVITSGTIAVASCVGNDPVTPQFIREDAQPGDGSNNTDATSTNESGVGDDGGATGDSEPGKPKSGGVLTVSISQQLTGGAANWATATSYLVREAVGVADSRCGTVPALTPNCSISSCNYDLPSTFDAGAPRHAGQITITPAGGSPIKLDAPTYASQAGLTEVLAPGKGVTFVGTGGDIPAFNMTINAPPNLMFSFGYGSIPRNVDFKVDWDATGEGTAIVVLASVKDGITKSVSCKTSLVNKSFTILSADLLNLDATSTGALSVSPTNFAVVDVADYDVIVNVLMNSAKPIGTVTIQ